MRGQDAGQEFGADWIAQDAINVHGENAVEHLNGVLRARSKSKNPAQELANEEVRKAISLIEEGKVARNSRLYNVNLNVDPDTLLDWDKPLSQQPNVVRALRNISDTPYEESSMFRQLQDRGFAPEQIENYRQAYNDRVSLVKDSLQDFELGATRGDTVVRLLERLGAENNAEASRMLREQGIPGIRYLDGMSRGAGEGSSNYVIFDDNLIELMRRYGIALPTGLLGYGMVRGQNNEAQ